MGNSKNIENFIEYWLDFSDDLRARKGINYLLLEKIKESLINIKKEFRDDSNVPKDLAGMFLDMYVVPFSTSSLYPSEQESEIIGIADQLVDLARDICL